MIHATPSCRQQALGLEAIGFAQLLLISCIWADEPTGVDFAARVQPIFAEHCYQCHGVDKQESGLRLDRRAEALNGGDSGALLVVGASKDSELVRRITATDDDRMPPAAANSKPLSP